MNWLAPCETSIQFLFEMFKGQKFGNTKNVFIENIEVTATLWLETGSTTVHAQNKFITIQNLYKNFKLSQRVLKQILQKKIKLTTSE